MGEPASAIRAGRLKLIEHLDNGRLELFDLQSDISENHDLAAEQPEKVKQLHDKLVAWRQSIQAPMPRPNKDFDAQRGHGLGPARQRQEEVD
jgi:arylsulfatase A